MKIYKVGHKKSARVLVENDGESCLLPEGISISEILSGQNVGELIRNVSPSPSSNFDRSLLAPIDDQDVWGCGVTYYNSKLGRNAESQVGGISCYDKVYSAQRPQIFYKSRGKNVVGPGGIIILRGDSSWVVPEPELVLVLNSSGKIHGVTIGNDVSCRDIEGENPLYQPQAKIWKNSCALGPCIHLISDGDILSSIDIDIAILREGQKVFEGSSNTAEMVRKFKDLVDILTLYREFVDGVYLFTGTGTVPPGDFSLVHGDIIQIRIPEIGMLENRCVSC